MKKIIKLLEEISTDFREMNKLIDISKLKKWENKDKFLEIASMVRYLNVNHNIQYIIIQKLNEYYVSNVFKIDWDLYKNAIDNYLNNRYSCDEYECHILNLDINREIPVDEFMKINQSKFNPDNIYYFDNNELGLRRYCCELDDEWFLVFKENDYYIYMNLSIYWDINAIIHKKVDIIFSKDLEKFWGGLSKGGFFAKETKQRIEKQYNQIMNSEDILIK